MQWHKNLELDEGLPSLSFLSLVQLQKAMELYIVNERFSFFKNIEDTTEI
jgi:hypothetical protein